ncbi:MAG: hypothetical protein JST12_09155 [Armatimonadetes bacterium]|nr:hypothetical protein [Armatimonadota bacterium]MBS1727316.1 hypothetical protein [Armatimonadota bacterium]
MSRSQLVYWSANEYVRRFWPAFIAFPVSGILMLVLMPSQVGIGLGMLMILWPLSIPARSILITGRAAKRVLSPTRMVAEGEHLYFITTPMDHNYRVNIKSVRDVIQRKEYVVVELWKFKLIYVPLESFQSPKDIKKLQKFTGVN